MSPSKVHSAVDILQRRQSFGVDVAAPLSLGGTPGTGPGRAGRIAALTQIAVAQLGIVTRDQLRAAGWRAHHVAHELNLRRWTRLTHDVVALQNGPLTYNQRLWVGLLHAGPGAALSHRTACSESGLEGWSGDVIDVLTEKGRNVPELPGFFFHETRRDYQQWIHPAASPARLRLDQAALLAAERQRSAKYGVALIASCVQQRLTKADRLFVASTEISRLRNGRILRAALGDIAGGAHSFAEIEVGRLCREAGLRPPDRQRVRRDKSGRRRYLDCEWVLDDGRVIVLEIDGGFHLEPRKWWEDMARERGVVISGRIVLRCASIEIRLEPESIVKDLRAIGVPSLLAYAA